MGPIKAENGSKSCWVVLETASIIDGCVLIKASLRTESVHGVVSLPIWCVIISWGLRKALGSVRFSETTVEMCCLVFLRESSEGEHVADAPV